VKHEWANTDTQCSWRLCTPRQPFSTAMTGARYRRKNDAHDTDCCTSSHRTVGCTSSTSRRPAAINQSTNENRPISRERIRSVSRWCLCELF